MYCVLWNFRNYFKFVKESIGERDEGPPCGWAWPPIGKKPETPPAESAFRIPPVFKEPPAARARGPRDQPKAREGEPGIRIRH